MPVDIRNDGPQRDSFRGNLCWSIRVQAPSTQFHFLSLVNSIPKGIVNGIFTEHVLEEK